MKNCLSNQVFLVQVTRENGKLKRQSQALIEKLGETKCDLKFLETITDESETSETNNNVSASELNVLNEKIACECFVPACELVLLISACCKLPGVFMSRSFIS